MKFNFDRRKSQHQLSLLLGQISVSAARDGETEDGPTVEKQRQRREGKLSRMLECAGLNISQVTLLVLAVTTASTLSFSLASVLSPWVLPVVAIGGFAAPFCWLQRRSAARATQFAADYPTMLLAAASSLKAGLAPFQALRRAVNLLPVASPVRVEVLTMLNRIDSGLTKEDAVSRFGENYSQPDLFLFRRAFLLALEHGGRFAPTLSRLATVSYSRAALIESAAVSTANMRMTANVLLIVGPTLLLLMTLRGEGYWDTLIHNSTANNIGSVGVFVLLGSLAILRWMSAFKP